MKNFSVVGLHFVRGQRSQNVTPNDKTRKAGKRLMIALLSGGLFWNATCGVSQANGTWNIALIGEGANSRIWPQHPLNPGWDWDKYPSSDTWFMSTGGALPGSAITTKSEGELFVQAIWTPSDPTDVIPESVNVKVSTTVSAGETQNAGGTSTYTLSVSPGPGVETTGLYGTTVRYHQKSATEKKLVKIPTQGAVLQPNGSYLIKGSIGTYSAQAQVTVGYNLDMYDDEQHVYYADSVSTSTSVDGSAQLDNRAVSLSRANAVNEWPTNDHGVPVKNGDTIYSHHVWNKTTSGFDVENEINQQTFIAALSGDNWATTLGNLYYNVQRTWITPNPLGETENVAGFPDTSTTDNGSTGVATAIRNVELGNIAKGVDAANGKSVWAREPESQNVSFYDVLTNKMAGLTAPPHTRKSHRDPQSVIVKHFAKDNIDGAVAEARYSLTFHEPYEIDSDEEIQPKRVVRSPVYELQPNGNHTPIVRGESNESDLYGIANAQVKTKGYALGVEGGGDLGVVPDILGFNFSISGGRTSELSVETGTYQEVTIPALDEDEFAYVVWVTRFTRHLTKYRRYDVNGEIRRAGSSSPPAKSIPYDLTWDVAGTPMLDIDYGTVGVDAEPPILGANEPAIESNEDSPSEQSS